MPDEIEALWAEGRKMMEVAGPKIVDISLPHTKYALPAYYVIAPAEASSNLARYDGVRYGHRAKLAQGDGVTEMYEKTRAEGFGPEVKRRVMRRSCSAPPSISSAEDGVVVPIPILVPLL